MKWPELDKEHLIKICISQSIELEELRAKLAAMESQEPVDYAIPNSAITGRKQRFMTLHLERCGQYPELMEPLYAKPVPADKPAVAVDEKTNYRGEPEAIYLQLHDPDEIDTLNVADYKSEVTWCWHKIHSNDVRYIREDLAAPSHSQQSARSPQDYAIEHAEYMAVNAESLMEYLNEISNVDDGTLVPDDRFRDYVGGLRCGIHDFRKRRDRCPSHEREQS